jgi:putative tricarboxylic transport membrane protein
MTVRTAELVMAIVMAIFSIYVMVKSAELPVGWIPEEGPGGGAFPFWLALGMLVCCVWIIINWVRKSSPPSQSDETFLSKSAARLVLASAGSLAVMIGLIHLIGVYGSTPLFMIFYMRMIGKHTWPLTLLVALLTPVLLFLFFEAVLTITLPKGYLEPLFYPLYDIFL